MKSRVGLLLTALISGSLVIGINATYGKISFSSLRTKQNAYTLPVYYTGSYYDSYDTSGTGESLLKEVGKASLDNHTTKSYKGLWEAYKTTDVKSDGTIWDMYSNCKYQTGTDQCGNVGVEGTCYNREHIVPQSWFNERNPYVCDIYHIVPTDGKVNGMRSNHPHGDVKSATYTSGNGSKLGTSASKYFSDTVFEVIPEYKGDFARAYLYMAVTYHDSFKSDFTGNGASAVFTNTFPYMTNFAIDTYVRWSLEDPVSKKEQDRNETASKWQGNRNPFVDNQNWVIGIWGEKYDALNGTSYFQDYKNAQSGGGGTSQTSTTSKNTTNTSKQTTTSTTSTTSNTSTTSTTSKTSTTSTTSKTSTTSVTSITSNTTAVTTSNSGYVNLKAQYQKVEAPLDDFSGQYLITYDDGEDSYILDSSLDTIDCGTNYVKGKNADKGIDGDYVNQEFTIAKYDSGYSIKASNGTYIGRGTSSSKDINQTDDPQLCEILYTGTIPDIKCNSGFLRFNDSAYPSRFRFYSSGQNDISLYKKKLQDAPTGGGDSLGNKLEKLSTKAQLTARGYESTDLQYGKNLSSSLTLNSFTGDSSGVLNINIKAGSKAFYIDKIIVKGEKKEYSYEFPDVIFDSNNQSKTLGDVSWKVTGSCSYFGYDELRGMQFGSSKNPCSNLVLSTSYDFGKITEVNVKACTGGSAKMYVSVGDNDYLSDATSKSFVPTNASINFKVHISNDLMNEITNNSSSYSFGFIVVDGNKVGATNVYKYYSVGATKLEFIQALKNEYGEAEDYVKTPENMTSEYVYNLNINFDNLSTEVQNRKCVIGYVVVDDKIYLSDQSNYSVETLATKLLNTYSDKSIDEALMLQGIVNLSK